MRQTILAATALCLAGFSVTACQTAEPAAADASVPSVAEDEAAITALLDRQDEAWNAGDIEGFMDGYWQSPELRFASGGTVVRGYAPTLERYRTRYSSRAAMGTLDTSDLEIVRLSPDAAIVHGRWQLERENDTPGGLFTLVLRRMDGEWKIISDTTTSAD
ncbi:YybH family protein [Henriciella mobilis]|uniref:Nuclear transport factor 2 family protein n=1 Tax=Henriciella mobilis TaxID=2305467 RepID=A0A399RLB1_9PROT|nr:nuclear transport factor 2 family protein [Henriciella mobilis]RIJ32466.1 nuclear transport factor 2 family protein [Henriciella mobilis]